MNTINNCSNKESKFILSSIVKHCVMLKGFKYENLSTERYDLLTNTFLSNCKTSYGTEDFSKSFIVKNLNIIDPLRDFNNLGRSVNYNNFLRIRRAFKKGAKILSDILNSFDINNSEKILNQFLKNVTLKYVGDDGANMLMQQLSAQNHNGTLSGSASIFDSKLEDCRTCLETAHSLLSTNSPSYSPSSNSQDLTVPPNTVGKSNNIPVPKTPPRRPSSVSNFIASPLSPLNSYAVYTRNLSLMNGTSNKSPTKLLNGEGPNNMLSTPTKNKNHKKSPNNNHSQANYNENIIDPPSKTPTKKHQSKLKSPNSTPKKVNAK